MSELSGEEIEKAIERVKGIRSHHSCCVLLKEDECDYIFNLFRSSAQELLKLWERIENAKAKAYFCPSDCKYLSISEALQNEIKSKPHHICLVFKRKVYHGNSHPKIYRYHECFNIAKTISKAIEEGK